MIQAINRFECDLRQNDGKRIPLEIAISDSPCKIPFETMFIGQGHFMDLEALQGKCKHIEE